jgi:arsenate reductase
MAEGLLRCLAGGRFEVVSAGTQATGVHPLTIRAMAEIGIDLSAHTSKVLDQFLTQPWDYVITVCDTANEACPLFPAKSRRLDWSFDDPSQATGTEEQCLAIFRCVRDQIKDRVTDWVRTP